MSCQRRVTIISGGQTGVDRAALDFAITHSLPHGGWCPRGRLAEDGPLDARYQLRQTPSARYAQRTAWNLRDADATLVVSPRRHTTGGTRLTLAIADRQAKPLLHLTGESTPEASAAALTAFLDVYRVQTLNVAGPRESQAPGAGSLVWSILSLALARRAVA